MAKTDSDVRYQGSVAAEGCARLRPRAQLAIARPSASTRCWTAPLTPQSVGLELLHRASQILGIKRHRKRKLRVTYVAHGVVPTAKESVDTGVTKLVKDEYPQPQLIRVDPHQKGLAVPLDLVSALSDLLDAGVRAFRLDFTIETAEEIRRITSRVRTAISEASSAPITEPLVQPATTGHYFRGVR